MPIKILLLLVKSGISLTLASQLRESILVFVKFYSHKLSNSTIQKLKFHITKQCFVHYLRLLNNLNSEYFHFDGNAIRNLTKDAEWQCHQHDHPVSVSQKSSLIILKPDNAGFNIRYKKYLTELYFHRHQYI